MIRRLTSAALLATASLSAQSFSYPNFNATTGLALLGNATANAGALRLTASSSNQTGWFWRTAQMPVIAGFDTTFTFRITPPTAGTKAEGMAFVIHDDPNGTATTGGTIWGMGYGTGANSSVGIRNSIAIEYDTYMDVAPISDTSANEVTIHTRGATGNHEYEQYSIARGTPATVLANGQVHSLRIRYVPGTIEVFVDGSATPLFTRAFNLVTGGQYLNNAAAPGTNLANGVAWLGFCATTGNGTLTELCEILSWDWTSTPLAHPCYAGSLGVDTLTVQGSSGGALREVHLATHQSFGIGIANPPGGTAAPYVLFASLLPQPGALGTQLGFGETCFPVLPFGASELVLADTFGLFPAVLPAAPTPYTIALPPGVVTSPLAITLQAVTLAPASPFGLGVTNAIDLDFAPSLPPTITAVAPLSAAVGQPITITGTRFLPGVQLLVNGAPVVPTTQTATQIVFPFPAGLSCGSQLAVVNPDGQGVTSPLNPQPVVTSTALGSGPAAGNAIFIVQGSGFATGTTVTIGGAPAVVLSIAATVVTLRTPPGTPGVAPVVLTTPGGCSVSTSYTYL